MYETLNNIREKDSQRRVKLFVAFQQPFNISSFLEFHTLNTRVTGLQIIIARLSKFLIEAGRVSFHRVSVSSTRFFLLVFFPSFFCHLQPGRFFSRSSPSRSFLSVWCENLEWFPLAAPSRRRFIRYMQMCMLLSRDTVHLVACQPLWPEGAWFRQE